MAFELWATPFVGSVTAISAAFLNKVRTELARAVDGLGGTYTQVEPLRFLGDEEIQLGGNAPVLVDGGSTCTISKTLIATATQQIVMTGTNRLSYTSRNIRRNQPLTRAFGTGWNLTEAVAEKPHFIADLVAQALWIPLSIPLNSTLVSVEVFFRAAGGHADVPGSPPKVEVVATSINDDTPGSVLGTDTFSGSLAAYEAVGGFSLTASVNLAHSLDSVEWWARVDNESGADAESDLKVYGCRTICAVTTQDEHPV
jgi:hypothetical protein